MKLFAIYIGGEFPGANIELHDIRFIIADSIEQTHDQLRKQWWGTPKSLHIDCWSELSQADGYKVTLKREPATDTQHKLYYVNLGGYDPAHFTEMHKNMFVVTESENKAKLKALKTVRHWNTFHQDEIFEAEQSFCISDVSTDSWYVHLEKIDDESPAAFVCGYKKIGRAAS